MLLTDVKVIQVDISAEEIGNNVPASVGLVGDVKAISAQLADAVVASKWQFSSSCPWWNDLRAKV
jgi:2-hydroxyacyl-CoA lyase 1